MAAFPAVLIDQPVLLTYVEWCETAHSAVIGMDQALLKCGSRPHPLNYQLDPPGGPTALYHGVVRQLQPKSKFCITHFQPPPARPSQRSNALEPTAMF